MTYASLFRHKVHNTHVITNVLLRWDCIFSQPEEQTSSLFLSVGTFSIRVSALSTSKLLTMSSLARLQSSGLRTATLALRKSNSLRVTLGEQGLRSISTTPVALFKEGDVKAEHYVPKSDRGGKNVFVLDGQVAPDGPLTADMVRLARNDRSQPTRELNFTPQTWGIHKSPFRKWRHMINIFKSSPFQRLAYPDLAGVAGVSVALTFYNELIAAGAEGMLSMDAVGFGGATTAIGLLAGFKLNASYGRYEECRIFWGE